MSTENIHADEMVVPAHKLRKGDVVVVRKSVEGGDVYHFDGMEHMSDPEFHWRLTSDPQIVEDTDWPWFDCEEVIAGPDGEIVEPSETSFHRDDRVVIKRRP